MLAKNLFDGMRFAFYPPRSISRLNGLKAKACAKRGAIVEEQPSTQTTHVLVAPDRTRSGEVEKFLSKFELNSDCEILSNEWPSACIENQKLLETAPFRMDITSSTDEISPTKRPAVEDQESTNEQIVELPVSPAKRSRTEDVHSSVPKGEETNANRATQEPLNTKEASQKPGHTLEENQLLVEAFHDLVESREADRQQYSARAYRQALKSLEQADTPIVTEDDALKLPHFSKRMAELVKYIREGKFTHVLSQSARQKVQTLQLFTTVYGVGPWNAQKLYDQGCRTLEDIKQKVDENGRVSIAHHEEFVERISRTEVSKHYEKVKKFANKIDPEVRAECMGSYRRGSLDCGDIDIVITKPNADLPDLKKVLKQLLDEMFRIKFATYTFTMGSDRWLGSTQVLSRWRRMDILLVPWSELGAAMIYYTGNDIFNRQIRLKAKKHGMRLNHSGLYKVDEDGGGQRLLEGHDERRIFELLDVEWLEPEERDKFV